MDSTISGAIFKIIRINIHYQKLFMPSYRNILLITYNQKLRIQLCQTVSDCVRLCQTVSVCVRL